MSQHRLNFASQDSGRKTRIERLADCDRKNLAAAQEILRGSREVESTLSISCGLGRTVHEKSEWLRTLGRGGLNL